MIFKGLKCASIDPLKCTGCGKCFDSCVFNAIIKEDELNDYLKIVLWIN